MIPFPALPYRWLFICFKHLSTYLKNSSVKRLPKLVLEITRVEGWGICSANRVSLQPLIFGIRFILFFVFYSHSSVFSVSPLMGGGGRGKACGFLFSSASRTPDQLFFPRIFSNGRLFFISVQTAAGRGITVQFNIQERCKSSVMGGVLQSSVQLCT